MFFWGKIVKTEIVDIVFVKHSSLIQLDAQVIGTVYSFMKLHLDTKLTDEKWMEMFLWQFLYSIFFRQFNQFNNQTNQVKIYFCVVGKYKIEKAKLITFLWKIHCFYQDYRYTYIIIVTRNGKIVWKHGPYCSCIRLNSIYLGVAVQSIHQNSEK